MARPKHGEYVHRLDLQRVLRGFRVTSGDLQEIRAAAGSMGGRTNRGKARVHGKFAYAESRDATEPKKAPVSRQDMLAQATGLSKQMISRYVNGDCGEWIELDRADLLLTTAGLHHHFLIDVSIFVFEHGNLVTIDGESARMAAVQGTGDGKFWCTTCQQVRDESEVVMYVDLGRMDLNCRSGKVQPLELAERLGLVRESG